MTQAQVHKRLQQLTSSSMDKSLALCFFLKSLCCFSMSSWTASIGLTIPEDAAAAMIKMKVFIARVSLVKVIKTGLLLELILTTQPFARD